MRKVLKLDVLSVVWLFVIFYAAVGLFASAKSVLTGEEKVYCPFGLHLPFLYFTVDINFKLPEWPGMLASVLLIIAVVFYALTGAISGFTAAWAYNLTSRFWPGIAATVEPEKKIAEAALPPPRLPVDPITPSP